MSTSITVLADDLSGAAETAAVFLDRQVPLTLRLTPGQPAAPGISVIDLNTRAMSAAAAQRTLRDAVAEIKPDTLVVKKIDSLLRGHIGPEVDVLAERGPVTVAAALPALNRTVTGGVLHLDGVPLHETCAWSAETASPPHSVRELFRAGVTVCDAETDADLDTIVRTAAPGIQLVGTAALAAAVARTLVPGTQAAVSRRPCPGLLVVVGTAETRVGEQVSHLVADGMQLLTLDAQELCDDTADPGVVSDALDEGPVVVTIRGNVDAAHSRELSAALGRLIALGQAPCQPDLILTGGETARAVVDAIGLTQLQPIHEVHHGAVVSVASDGRSVATRPGSFGDSHSLSAIAGYLTSLQHVHPQQKDNS